MSNVVKVSELYSAEKVNPDALFVIEQDGQGKKLPGSVLRNWLSEIADSSNLLDNSYFPNAINQRGVSTTTLSEYCIDRFIARTSDIALSIESDGLHMTSQESSEVYIYQKIAEGANLLGKKVTIALCDENGTISCTSAKIPSSKASSFTVIASTNIESTILRLVDLGDSSQYPFALTIGREDGETGEIVIKWIAMYVGEYDVDTLPMYRARTYAEELLNCQRYAYIVGSHWFSFSGFKGVSDVWCTIPLPISMIKTYPKVEYSGSLRVVANGNSYPISEIVTSVIDGNLLIVKVNGDSFSGIASSSTCSLAPASIGTLIVSADL